MVGFELRHMEDWVDAAHVLGELESNRMSTRASDDLVGAEILLRKFL